jgi:hypothetical protein
MSAAALRAIVIDDQVPAQHRRQLPGVAVGELAKQDPERGSRA